MQTTHSHSPIRRPLAAPLAAAAVLALAASARAEVPRDFLQRFSAEAGAPAFVASATRGERFFTTTHGNDWSCASCHGQNPAAVGKHARTGKAIDPLAPAANAERFVRADRVDKWFRRNCGDVLGRACSAAEKADLLAYLLTVPR